MIYMFKVILYYLQTYLKTLEKNVLKYTNFDPAYFLPEPGLSWQVCLKKTRVKLELLTDIDMLLMVENGIRDRICHACNT